MQTGKPKCRYFSILLSEIGEHMIIVISKVISNDWGKILSGIIFILSYLSKAKDKSKPSLVPSHTCHI